MVSVRIKEMVKYLDGKQVLVDVGCDHGYLIIEGFLNNKIKKAFAIDNKIGPLNNAKTNISKYDFYKDVTFLLSDGLEKLTEEFDVIVFGGMGGLLITELLKKEYQKLKDARIIIQANRNNYEIRKYLVNQNYKISEESIIFDDSKFYEIIIFEKNSELIIYEEKELYLGPVLLKNKENIYKDKLFNDLRILENIPHKSAEILAKINLIKENLW